MNIENFDTSPNGIVELVKGGESAAVEFKTKLPAADTVSRVLAAFANSSGGILLIGVSDDGGIVGLSDEEVGSTMARLHRIASSLLPQPIQIGCVNVEGRSIVFAIISQIPSQYGPVTSSRGEVYQRVGEATVRISSTSVKRAIRTAITKRGKLGSGVVLFVAMSFREEEEPALTDYFRAMQRAVTTSALPIKIRRVDLVDGDYEIGQKIIDEIDKADIVLVDFTLNSRNVYFELGYARGKGRRVIQTARKGTELEFDVRNWRTTFYRNATELEEKLLGELHTAFSECSRYVQESS
jgi:hypothetical protein